MFAYYYISLADLDILCGLHSWNGDDPLEATYNIKRPGCKRICVFRNETIQTLRSLGPNAGNYFYNCYVY